MLKLITNHGEFIVGVHPTLEQVGRYYSGMQKAGMSIEEIKFKCVPLTCESVESILTRLVPDSPRLGIENGGMAPVNRIAHR